jgi:hypothetical protein
MQILKDSHAGHVVFVSLEKEHRMDHSLPKQFGLKVLGDPREITIRKNLNTIRGQSDLRYIPTLQLF